MDYSTVSKILNGKNYTLFRGRFYKVLINEEEKVTKMTDTSVKKEAVSKNEELFDLVKQAMSVKNPKSAYYKITQELLDKWNKFRDENFDYVSSSNLIVIAKKLYILNEDGSIATDENGFYLYNDYALRIIQHLAGTELENAIAQGGIMSVKEAAEDIDIVNVLKTLPDVRQELIDLARGYSEKDRNKVNNQAGDHDDNSKETI